MAQAGVPPAAVVKAIVRLCEARRMPLRTLVGTDSKGLDALYRWLPRNAAPRLLRWGLSKMLPAS